LLKYVSPSKAIELASPSANRTIQLKIALEKLRAEAGLIETDSNMFGRSAINSNARGEDTSTLMQRMEL
jgi:hypothetical protein